MHATRKLPHHILLAMGLMAALEWATGCAGLLDPLPDNHSRSGGSGDIGLIGGGGTTEIGGNSGAAGTGGHGNDGGAGGGMDMGAAGEPQQVPNTDLVLAYSGSGATKGVNASMGIHNNGHQFEVSGDGISVVDLGVWDDGADGLASDHTVTLFSLDKLGADALGTPVAGGSVTVKAGANSMLDSGDRFARLDTPIPLGKGPYAVVAYGLKWNEALAFLSSSGKFLKIMPLGDSITVGIGSETGAGYRLQLAQMLGTKKVDFQFVGSASTSAGMFLSAEQTHHEGHEGAVIAGFDDHPGIAESINAYLGPTGATPDIILLMIGTNDIDLDYMVADAPNRVDALLNAILNPQTGAAARARVILAQLPPINDATEEARVLEFNKSLVAVVAKHKGAGQNVSLVDMHSLVQPADFSDKLNPKDSGYAKMAQVWATPLWPTDWSSRASRRADLELGICRVSPRRGPVLRGYGIGPLGKSTHSGPSVRVTGRFQSSS